MSGPFSNNQIKHYLLSVQTQRGIIEYAEAMSQFLAEAGRASQKATGDAASIAVRRWSKVIEDRALEILQADKPRSPVMEKFVEMEKLLGDE